MLIHSLKLTDECLVREDLRWTNLGNITINTEKWKVHWECKDSEETDGVENYILGEMDKSENTRIRAQWKGFWNPWTKSLSMKYAFFYFP